MRLRRSDEFTRAVRGRIRVARPTLVLHAIPTDPPTKVGFVVSKAVGNAVTRNRVKRRLRHLVADRLPTPVPVHAVVRALPAAAADSGRLAQDLDSSWRLLHKRLAELTSDE